MFQKTIKREIILSGVALHSGKDVSVKILPSAVDSGITFVRGDIKGKPAVKAIVKNVKNVKRGTNLTKGKAEIYTVEHLLSALAGLGITNAKVEMDGPEPPILDGSAKGYVKAIKAAGIRTQNKKIRTISISEPLLVGSRTAQVMALPSDRFAISFMINYPSSFVGSQMFTFDSDNDSYESQVAPARTYGFLKEVKGLLRSGLIKGATLKNTVAITARGYSTKLRFKDELVRHKVLDLIGDLALTGHHVCAHVIGIKSGHDLNVKLAKILMSLGGKKR